MSSRPRCNDISVAVVIPARFASRRLPGKALLDETGKYLIQHVYEQVNKASTVDQVILATDDERVVRAAKSFGARVAMTSPHHLSGTDRVAEVARGLEHKIIINVQGDEPEIDPDAIDQLACLMATSPELAMGTLAFPMASREEYESPDVVKVVVDNSWNALYFSRAPIPHNRGGGIPFSEWPVCPYHHMGIYGFRRDFLLQFVALPPGRLEKMERLEQLRALEHGFKIRVGLRPGGHPGIDTREDYRAFVQRYKERS